MPDVPKETAAKGAEEEVAVGTTAERETVDPAATDATSENARNGARKRRDPNEPVAVVGLGASAGGVAVLQQFFTDIPPDSGMAFVVVMHLSPDHESNLAAVIQQKTSMPVTQVTEANAVERNHVYVIPPNKQLTFEDSSLHLIDPQQALGRRVTIDLFFRTLAYAYGQRAVGIILSGTDSDGVIGLKHVRAQGGVTIAQDPREAEHESMPSSAISTGMIDWVLPVSEMPGKLVDFVRNENRMQLPPEDPAASAPDVKVVDAPGGETIADETHDPEDESALVQVLAHLRAQTGHDFSHYKRATVLRRTARRLQVNSLETIPQYLEFIRTHPAESRALLHDLLIGVTHFFRDQAAFAALEANVPQLFAGKRKEDQIRVWVPGCATGEEAYSVAILLCEQADRLESPPSIQVFASDIDEEAVANARSGICSLTIEADVSAERLRRFFAHEYGHYRVRKDLREKVLFASHDLLKDAPFSRIDLISCRNLLIYLNEKAQNQVFDIFHFSLRTGGLLFIGGSESGSNVQSLFSPLDPKHRIYVRRSVPRPTWKMPMLPLGAPEIASVHRLPPRPAVLPRLTSNLPRSTATVTAESLLAGQQRRAVLFGELHLKLLEQYGPPSVVVNEAHEIVHLSENAGRYLHFVAGEPSANITSVVLPALRIELRAALFRASQNNETVESDPLELETEGEKEIIRIKVRPIGGNDPAAGYYLVLFDKQPEAAGSQPSPVSAHELVTCDLENEIQSLKRQLDATVEQYEATNEELKASNEELQAVNEEMRSTTEELETSTEELQSVNEELITVNHELKNSVEELSRANADLTNLMASTDIGTIFLDRQLRVNRFTPTIQAIFNLIPADVGRPLSDITHKLSYDGLTEDAEKVLRELVTIEHEVKVGDNTWFLTRIAPYRVSDDRIAGVVATFVDITRRKQAEMEVIEASRNLERQTRIFETTLSSLADFAYSFNKEGRFVFANRTLADLLQVTPEEMVGKNFFDLGYPKELAAKLQSQIQLVFATKQVVRDETPFTSPAGHPGYYEYIFRPVVNAEGTVEFVVGSTRDLTDRKISEQALRESEERFRQFAENSADVFWIVDAETQRVEYVNPVYEKMWGESREALFSEIRHGRKLVHPDDLEKATQMLPRTLTGETYVVEYRIIRPNDGTVRYMRDTGFPIRDETGRITRVAGVIQDVTEDKKRAEALRGTEERFRLLIEGARDYAMFMMDESNVITFWSNGAERVFGWNEEEALGQDARLIFTPEDQARGEVEKEVNTALRERRALDRRFHMRKDGSRFWADGVLMRLDRVDGSLRGFAKIARDASEQREAEDQLRHARDELEQRVVERTAELMESNSDLKEEINRRQQLERDLLEISEHERRRIGQDLHDVVCQELTATALFLKSAGNRAKGAEARNLNEAAQIVNRNVTLARELARGFQPAIMASGGLSHALRTLCAQANNHDGIHCHFKLPRAVRIRDETIALNIYRIAQEAISNAVKHAKATEIMLCLERERDDVRVVVEDNGKGFTKKKRSTGLGLHIMQYRASVLGGHFSIKARPKEGTRVVAAIPIKKSRAASK